MVFSYSWTCPLVIMQEEMMGGGPPDEDPIPIDGNPRPRLGQAHFHINQENHMIEMLPLAKVNAPQQQGIANVNAAHQIQPISNIQIVEETRKKQRRMSWGL